MKTWPEIFASAAKWPELRVYRWKDYKKEGKSHQHGFIAMLNAAAKPGATHTVTLSSDLVWAISKLSYALDPVYLFEQVVAARMPFMNTVVEWHGEDRRQAYNEMGVAQELDQIHPTCEHPAFMVMDKEGRKHIHSLSYDEATKKFIYFPLVFEVNMNEDRSQNSFYAASENAKFSVADYMFTTKVLRLHPEAAELVNDPRVHIRMAGPIYAAAIDSANPLPFLMAGTAGQFRWFGALCALLNRQGVVRYVDAPARPEDPAQPVQKGDKAPSRPQVLTLMLPRDRVVQRVVRAAAHERKKVGLHEVMGHWAYSHRKGDQRCFHKWPVQPTRRQVCEACGMVRWWKTPHKRGQGNVVVSKPRRADYTGMSIERLAETIKEGH